MLAIKKFNVILCHFSNTASQGGSVGVAITSILTLTGALQWGNLSTATLTLTL